MSSACELTILMPCLNEAETIAVCIRKARGFLERARIDGEVLIADNGSTDGSTEIATQSGARVARIGERGYGAALLEGRRARPIRDHGDADDSWLRFHLPDDFVEKLRAGYQLVMGNRFRAASRRARCRRCTGGPATRF
jgi:glycosyltransferase involved in cell wall biosynthesis